MRKLLKRIAVRFPIVREHVENVRSLVRQNETLASELAVCKSEREKVNSEFRAFRNRFNTRIGGFEPDVHDPSLSPDEKKIVDEFNDLYYRLGQQGRCTYIVSWLGYATLKSPVDLWMYQELICKLRPDFIVETGTASGGSALFLASMCDLVGHGEIVSIDIAETPSHPRPMHPRLSYVTGSSTDPLVIADLRKTLQGKHCGMVILDSDHAKAHVLAEMRIFQEFVPVGGYLIVEDTNINGHPTYPAFGPGPMEAVEEFLLETDSFQVDPSCERFLLTMNPKGYLRRHK